MLYRVAILGRSLRQELGVQRNLSYESTERAHSYQTAAKAVRDRLQTVLPLAKEDTVEVDYIDMSTADDECMRALGCSTVTVADGSMPASVCPRASIILRAVRLELRLSSFTFIRTCTESLLMRIMFWLLNIIGVVFHILRG